MKVAANQSGMFVIEANTMFFGAPDQTFTIANQLDPEWVAVNAGTELSLSNRLSTKVSLTSDMGRGVLTNNQANLTLNWNF